MPRLARRQERRRRRTAGKDRQQEPLVGGRQDLQVGGPQGAQERARQPPVGMGQQRLRSGGQQELPSGGQQQMQSGGQQQLQSGGQQEMRSGGQKQLRSGMRQLQQSGGQKAWEAGGQQKLKAGAQQGLQAGGQQELAGGQQEQAGGQQALEAEMEVEQGGGEQQELQAGGQQKLQAGAQQGLQAGGQQELAGGQQALEAEMEVEQGAGEQQELQAGGQQEQQAGARQGLQAGGQQELAGGQQALEAEMEVEQGGGEQQELQAGGQQKLQDGGQQEPQAGGQQEPQELEMEMEEPQEEARGELPPGQHRPSRKAAGTAPKGAMTGRAEGWGPAGGDRSSSGKAAARGTARGDWSTPERAAARGTAGGDPSTPGSAAARGAAGGDRSTPGRAAARGAAGGDWSTPERAAARGGAGGDRSTPERAAAKGAAGGDWSTPGSAAARGAAGGDPSTPERAAARGAAGGDRSTPGSAAARGVAGGDRSTPGNAAARGAAGSDRSTPGRAAARGAAGGDRSTPGRAAARGAAGGDRSTPGNAAARGAVDGRPGAAVGGVEPTLELDTPMATAEESEVDGEPPRPPSPCPRFPCDTCFHTFATRGAVANHMRVCRAAEAESRAQALGSIPSLVETDTQERPTPREFGDEAWAGVTSWEWEAFFSVEAVGGRTVRQIPQRARSGVLDALCCVLKRLKSRPGDEAATLLLLAFPRLILAVPPKPGIGQKALITERLGAFWEGRWRELFDSAMVAARPAVRPLAYTCSDKDPDAIRLSRCRSRCKVGKWSRGMACLTAGELARPSEAMVQSLREKHPASTGEFSHPAVALAPTPPYPLPHYPPSPLLFTSQSLSPTPRSPLPYFPVVASPSSPSSPLPPPHRRLSLLPVVASPSSPSSPLPPPRRRISLLPVVASPSSPPSPLPPPRRRLSLLPAVASPSSPSSPLPPPRRRLSILPAVASPSSPPSPLPPSRRRLSLLPVIASPAVASPSSPPSPLPPPRRRLSLLPAVASPSSPPSPLPPPRRRLSLLPAVASPSSPSSPLPPPRRRLSLLPAVASPSSPSSPLPPPRRRLSLLPAVAAPSSPPSPLLPPRHRLSLLPAVPSPSTRLPLPPPRRRRSLLPAVASPSSPPSPLPPPRRRLRRQVHERKRELVRERGLPSRIAALFALVALASLLTCIFLSLPPAAPPPLPLVPLTAIAAAAHPHAAVTAAGGRGGTARRLQGLRAPRDTKRKWNGGSFLEFSADESARINGLGGSGSARDARAQRESGEKGAEKTRNSGWPGVNRRGGGMVWRVGWWGGGGGSDGSKSDAVGASDERAHGGVAESARALAVTARGGRGGLHSEGGKSRGAREAKGEAQDAVAPVVEAQQVEGRGEGGGGVATGMRAVGRLADMEVLPLGQGMGGRRQAVAGGDEGGSACERMAGRAVQRVGRRGALVPEEGRAPANATSPARRGGESRARAAAEGRGQWRVRRVALHPAVRRSTGLPLRCHQWRSDAVFLLSAALPGHGLSPLLLVRPRLPTCPLPTIFPSKLSHILPLLLRSPPFPTYSPLVSLFIPSAFPLSPPLCFHTCFPPCFFPSSCFLASSPRCPPMCTPLCGAMPCRGQELDARLQAVGLQHTLALVPRNVSHAHALRYAPLYRAAPQGGGRAGAGRQDVRYSAAHAEVWARVVAARMPFALVLEEDALNRSEGVAAWQARFEMLLWELNLLMLQRADRFFFDVLLLARHGLAPYAEQQLAPGIVSAQPSEAMHAYLLSYAGAKRLLALSRFHSPVAESTGGIPGMTILAAEPPLFATTIFACSPKPCRTPPPALSLPASTRLTPACRSTILLTLPAHPSMPGAALHAPWRMHDPVPAGPRPSIPSSSPAFCPHLSPAQCLLANHLPRLLPHVRAPPLLLLPPTLPPSLPLWPAYVLSLRRSPQRLQRVLPLLQQQGFGDVVVAHGVDGGRGQRGGEGAQGRGEEAEAEAERNLDVFGGLVGAGAVSVTRRSIKWHKLAERRRERLTRGEVACALSHYLVWLEVLRRKLPYTIILEDDVTFTTSTFRADFERNIAEANELLTRQHSPESPPDIMFVGHMGVLAGHFMPLLSPHIAWDPLSWCSFAYIISHRGAARLVAGFKVDDPLDSLCRAVASGCEPPAISHLTCHCQSQCLLFAITYESTATQGMFLHLLSAPPRVTLSLYRAFHTFDLVQFGAR
ncbi:unnamed protein product [Closterium sp. Naga37s-1]|nr:unnamed protein product [Closterium sp. Naga37s-1]